MKRTSILEATGLFIKARLTPHNADLVKLWSDGQETQINVSADGGEPVPEKKGRYTNGTDEWGHIRIPRDSATDPHFRDYPAPWPLDERADAIGMSGWNWKERKSYWIGFELDDLLKHLGTGVSKEEIERVVAALKKLPYVMIRRGTSGTDSSGIHVYVFVAGIPTANHNEHAALANAVVAKIARDTGLDIQASIDVCGRILWFWARRASEAKRSYECLQASTLTLIEEDLPNWRDFIPKKKEKTDAQRPPIEESEDHKRFFAEYQKRGWPFEHVPKHNCYHMHLAGMRETADALGHAPIPTDSPGTDKTKANIKVYLRRNGFYLVCFGDMKVGPEWGETDNGQPAYTYRFIARPVIRITTDLDEMVRQSIRALCADDNTLQHGVLSEMVEDAPKPKYCLLDNGAPRLRPISAPTLTRKLSKCARFEKYDKRAGKWGPSLPTEILVNATLSSADYPGILFVANVVSCPMLRMDGSVAKKPGLDKDTGLYLHIDGDYPDIMDSDVAVEKLKAVVYDFPFVTEHHRSAWFAALVTAVSRAAFPGPAPFFLSTANMPGVGKTMLFDTITAITENRLAARYPWSKSLEEQRKVITTVCLNGVPYLFLDNCDGKIGGSVLDEVLTGTRWTDRLLGVNKSVDLPLNFVTFASGNNCTLSSAMVRRTCAIELQTNLEHPSKREDFQHRNLLQWVKENRRELVMAALSIPVNYIAADRPKVKMEPWGSFEDWSNLVRASLIHAGLPDPDTRATLAEQADEDTALLRQLMAAWEELGGPATVGEAVTRAGVGDCPTLLALLNELPDNDRDRKNALGRMLRDFRGRVVGNKKFDRTNSKIPQWQLVTVA